MTRPPGASLPLRDRRDRVDCARRIEKENALNRLASIAIVVAALSLAACGENQVERGLSPPEPDEVNNPESAKDMRETEQQREQAIEQREQQREIERFDEGEKAQP
jgi:hypothetical protein